MTDIRPFRAYRPAPQFASRTAALPYDVYNRAEASEAAKKDPLSFLNIDRPETQFGPEQDMYAQEVYEKASEMLRDQIERGIYLQDEKPCYYVYELTMNGRTQTGLAACASVDDYLNNIVKKHENTRADKELDRIRHVDICSMQTGPIFLAYRSDPVISEITGQVKNGTADVDFTSEDGIRHRVFVIREEDKIERIRGAFANIPEVYIADGHHRAASAVKAALLRRKAHPDYTGDEEFNSFLSVLFPDEELMIMDYNRIVLDRGEWTDDDALLEKLSGVFRISPANMEQKPEEKGSLLLFLGGKRYSAQIREEFRKEDPIAGLDVSLLQDLVLDPIFGIRDPRTDKRIEFAGGIRGYQYLERRVQETNGIAFAMHPTSIDELFAAADANLLMPPKSTWFEPKLRSGLFFHEIER